ncbi:MAG: cytochrome c peroxidase [Planctomycetota bacterium]|jgi:cytochrome c peroxidase
MQLRIALASALACATATAQLQPMYAPVQNPQTPEKIMLGKFLFWEEQLSSDNTVACGTCHLPEFGGGDGRIAQALTPGLDNIYGTDDDIHGSPGIVRQSSNGDFVPSSTFGLRQQATGRTSPSNIGSGHQSDLFWDQRASSTFIDPETGNMLIPFNGALESQALDPIMSPVEMGRLGRTWNDVRQKLQAAKPMKLASNLPADMVAARLVYPSYPDLFTAAFGDPAISAARIAFALGSYQRTLNPDQTRWDAFMAGNPTALTPYETQGWQMFQNAGRCISCHWEPLFADDLPHNLGLRPNSEDIGAFATTGLAFDIGGFKTPTLRNAGLRTRLFHNGQSPALDDPAQFSDPASTLNVYLQGSGVDPSNLDPFMLPLQGQLSAADIQIIQDFIVTALTDPRCANRQPPFDHPDLRSAAVAPPRQFGPSLPGASEPFVIDSAPPFPGNFDYRLGVAGGDGAGLALLTYGFQSFEPNLSFAGLPWHVDVHDWIPIALQGSTGSPGYATLHLPIPDVATLSMFPLYWQLFVDDPLAPNGIASSKGWEFIIQ